MTSKTLCQSLMILFPLALPAAVQPITPAIVQSSTNSGPSAPITLSLNTAPTPGNMVYAVIGYGIYAQRTIVPPDTSWTCNLYVGGYGHTNVCSHMVAPGDATSYTFIPTSTDGPGLNGILFEASGTTSAQVATSYAGNDLGNLQSVATPSLTPSVLNTLPVAFTSGGGLPSAGAAGWASVQATPGLGVFVANTLTTDTTTPISTTLNYHWNNGASSIQALILLVPGTFASAPTATPAAGSYPTTQQVVLSNTLAGAVIHYTLDGSTPSCASPVYASPIAVTTTSTLAYLACAPGYTDSGIQTATYVIAGGTLQGVSLGAMADLHGYVPFAGDAFHQNISASPVDSNSTNIISGIGAGHLHHDWSSINGGNYGIPYIVVDSTVTPFVPFVNQLYSDESDLTLFPIPNNLPIESLPPNCTITGDNHAIMLDKATGVDYELYQAQYCPGNTPTWQASNGVLWDMTKIEKRPYSYTSVDAAGLSVFEGLIRYDEIVAGVINHAMRFTVEKTRCDHYVFGDGQGAFVLPATHAACTNSGTLNIMGMRIRLKASFDISKYSPVNQIILTAMKNYGMILADNGSSLFFQGTPDSRWNDDDLQNLDRIGSTNFEVIQMPPVYTNDNYPSGNAPTINSFTASSPTITAGQSVTLLADTKDASYSYVDLAGFVRNSAVTTTPTETTTYTLTSRNEFGTISASTTVTVVPPSDSKKDAGLAFAPIAPQTLGNAPFAVSASSQSSGQIVFSVLSGPASLSGNIVTLNGVGTVVLQATQSAAGAYTAATATSTFEVSGTAPSLAFTPVADVVFGASPFLVSASSSSPATIVYSVISGSAAVSGSTVSVQGAGAVILQATQAATGKYTAATVQVTFNVKPAAPQLAFTQVPNKTFGTAPFTVFSTSNSGGGNTYSVVSGPATVYGNTVTLTGVGRVILMVTQAAAGNYAAATATTSFKSLPGVPQLSFNPIPNQTYGVAPFSASASSTSTGVVTYTVTSGPAVVYGNVVTVSGTGTITLAANQAATDTYSAATTTVSFSVTPQRPALSVLLPSSDLPYLTPLNFAVAIAASGNAYPTGSVQIFDGAKAVGVYAMPSNTVGGLSGLQMNGLAPGMHTITAVYSGDANYMASTSTVASIVVSQKLKR